MSAFQLVLASTSPFRRELLARLRVPFETAAPRFAEIAPPAASIRPEQVRALVLENARGKAHSLRTEYPDALILASDQLCECEGAVLQKPGTEERALEQLSFLRGKEHRLHTSVLLLNARDGRVDTEVITSELRIRDLPEAQLRRYIELERPLNCAGSYLSEGLGIALFEYLRGDDPTAVIGLPLIASCRLLEAAGVIPLQPEDR